MATTYYVRPDGNDNNTGLGPSAWEAKLTISGALAVANIADVIWVAPGTYSGFIPIDCGGSSWSDAHISIIGDPTGNIFGLNPGKVIVNTSIGMPQYTSVVDRWAYYLFKNIVFATANNGAPAIEMEGDKSCHKEYHFYNCAFNVSNYHILRLDAYYRSSIARGYNCSFYDKYIESSNNSKVYLYNCAFDTTTVQKLQGVYWGYIYAEYCISNGTFTVDTNSDFISGDPLFNDPSHSDFNLKPWSQAIDSGYHYDINDEPDVYGYTRVQRGSIDRGAAECLYSTARPETVIWTYPAYDRAAFFLTNPWVVFTAPSPSGIIALNFKVGCYADAAGNYPVVSDKESYYNPEYFKVWNGAQWIDFPAGGIGPAYYGSSIAVLMSDVSLRDSYYFRAWAGVAT